MGRLIPLALLPLCTLLACAAPTRSRDWLARSVQARTSLTLGSGAADAGVAPGVRLEDGLTATEAASLALWNNPSLHAEFTQLEASLASLDEAQRPANPRLNNLLAPLDPRQLAIVLFVPIESIWQMPSRMQAATADLEASADTLLQIVLDTERTVRSAHADVLLAQQRIEVLQRAADAWGQSVELADGRATAGDIAPAEADALRAEWLLARDAVQRAQHEVNIARARLMTLLGLDTLPAVVASALPLAPEDDLAGLQTLALKQRPELSAAALSINAAAARARWERSRVFSIFLSIDGQAPVGGLAPQFAPGLQAELPIFSQNQGGIGRADAAVVRATHRYAATRLTVLQEVAVSHASMLRARSSRAAAERITALLEQARAAAARAFENGSESYVVVVDALRRTTDAQLRELETEAELRRAEAEFLRAVGGRNLVGKP